MQKVHIKILVTVGFLLALLICNSCRIEDTTSEANFEHSSYFKYTLGLCSSDTPCAYSTIQTTLSEINEIGFIHSEDYEYYIIAYTHGLLLENRAFVIKKDKLGTHIIFKSGTSKSGRNVQIEKCSEDLPTLFNSNEISATLSTDKSFNGIKAKIEEIIKNTKPVTYDVLSDASSEIFYFNGKDYFNLSFFNLELKDYFKLEQLIYSIKNSKPFICLRSSDPAFMPDNQDSIFDYNLQKQ
ncbi:MAG: hypothetical protein JNM21_14790 [Taibaiella sp.]|nr:hypothetical protein [Taibaiella sp.]